MLVNGAFCVVFLAVVLQAGAQKKIDKRELQCLVCEKAIEAIEKAVSEVNPRERMEAGGYRLDGQGNMKMKEVPRRNSEIYLSELLDTVCDKMDDYVRARWKASGKLMLLKLMEGGGMNPLMSKVDIVQDDDLNKSLKYYCEMLMEEHEDAIIRNFVTNDDNIDINICSTETNYCSDSLAEDVYRAEL